MTDGPPPFDPPPAYGPPPPYRAPAPPPPAVGSTSASRRNRAIGAVAAVAIVVIGVIAYLLASSGSSGAATPQDAVRRLLEAGRKNDVAKATALLCAGDRAIGQVSHLLTSGTITGYTLGAQTSQSDVTFVAATFSTSRAPVPTTEQFPVVKEGGSWKVCFSREIAALPATLPSGGIPNFTLPTLGVPGGGPGQPTSAGTGGGAGSTIGAPIPSITDIGRLCTGSTSGFGVASTYVGAAEIGVPQVAQGCVYRDAVPLSVAQRLSGKLFGPVTADPNASVIVYQSSDGSTRVTVTTAKEPDGRYYVTAVTIG
jgi:hypothetical protein